MKLWSIGLLLAGIAAPAAAEPSAARCVVNLVGKGSYSGPCLLDKGRGGSFTIVPTDGGVLPGGATDLQVAVASPRQAMVTAISDTGNATRWGAARQAATGCWLAMTHSVCVNDQSGKSMLVFTGAPAPKPRTWTVTGRLKDMDLGDSAWLGWTDVRGRAQSGICAAEACDGWIAEGHLPRAYVGRVARLTLKAGKAMSGDVVMADADEVIGLELLPKGTKLK